MAKERWILRFPCPNRKQRRFLLSRKKYVAFGGARGGGKSWSLRIKAILLCLRYPGIQVLIIRETYKELWKNHIEPLIKILGNKRGAKYNDSKKEYRFYNGSVIQFGYCANEGDMGGYQGTEADVIFIDEATAFDEKIYKMFAACLRGVNQFPKRIYLTCNPGGKGHQWVKRLFVDRNFNDDENPDDYEFIQSFVTDNTALMKAQPEYKKQLEALPPKLRDAWLLGLWDVFEGQFFEEFKNDTKGYDTHQWTHVINPIPVSNMDGWPRYRSFDFGYAKPFSVGYWALSRDGVMYRIASLYGCQKDAYGKDIPNEGVKNTPEEIFARMVEFESSNKYLKGHRINGVADPSIWDASRGVSIADTAAKFRIYFEPGDNKRLPGWMQMHYRLAFDDNGRAMMYVFNTCKEFVRTIPGLIYSAKHPEDLDTTGEDHVADEVRYFCMMNPISPRRSVRKVAPSDDPLNMWADANEPHDKYAFYRF